MEPRFGVNVATTWGWSLAECVDAWVRRGVPAIGLGAQIIDAHGRAEGVKLLRDSGLRVSTFTTISPAAMDAGTIESTLDLAAEVGADCVYVITGGRKATVWRDAVDIFKEEFGPSRELARERGVRLAIEPMHPLRQDLSFLNTARGRRQSRGRDRRPQRGVRLRFLALVVDARHPGGNRRDGAAHLQRASERTISR